MLIKVRSILFLAIFLPATALFALPVLLTWPLPLAVREAVARHWCRLILGILRIVCGVRYHVEGLERLPPGPAVILSKHQSTWETIAYRAIFPRQLSWVVKKSLFRVPFYGWALRALEEIGIDREAGREALRQIERYGIAHLRAGRWIVIFPEGQRNPPGVSTKYAQGGARLARAAGVPAVPVAVNSGHCWPHGDWHKYPGTITVRVGEPIATEGRSAAEVNRMAHEWIEAQMRELDSTDGT